MKNVLMTAIAIFFLYAAAAQSSEKNLHDFVVTDIYGDTFDMSQLKGKKVMIVNTASKCGLTPQFEALEKLYRENSDNNFVVIGFPANNFNQELGTAEEIITFCEANYGVTFPMMSKISVKGDDMHPLYQWLTQKEKNKVKDSEVSWNFQKYLIDESGNLVAVYPPRESPLSEEILAWIEQ
jgi:glutathione peroxidase